jgi:1-acyl-sn-glycerol-3-phosphate acyltransferase
VAVRVISRGHQYPEALVDIAPEAAPDGLPAALAARLRELDGLLLDADPRLPVPGFRCAVAGRRSWDERLSHGADPVRR